MVLQRGVKERKQLFDFVIVAENPIADFKVLYGTGAIRLDENNEVVRTEGVRYTVKDGIVYDAQQLLEDVKAMVKDSKSSEGVEIRQPGETRAKDR